MIDGNFEGVGPLFWRSHYFSF